MKYTVDDEDGNCSDSDTCTLAGPEPRTTGVKDGLFYPFLKYRSRFASLVTPNGDSRYIFYQAHDGSINEAQYRNPGWCTRTIAPREKATMGTPLAAVSWPGADGGNHFRLYYVSRAMQIHELCFEDGKWFEGSLNGSKVEIDGSSDLAATCYSNGKEIRVYYQTSDFTLRELVHSGTWKHGHSFESTRVLPGSSLSFLNLVDVTSHRPSMRGYYQDVNGTLKEVAIDAGGWWRDGEFTEYLENTTFLTPIAATACQCNDGVAISVFYLDGRNRIINKPQQRGEWSPGSVISGKKAAPGSSLAASSFSTGDREEVELQLYTTLPLNCLGQFVYRNAAWDSNPQVYGGGIIPLNMVMSMQMVVQGQGGEGSDVRKYRGEGGALSWGS